jgi:preprotein translocase subunit SecY
MVSLRIVGVTRRIPEILRKAGLALAALVVCELGARIVAPGLDTRVLRDFIQSGSVGWLLRAYDWVGGGALGRGAVLAIGIMPYISARIMMRLARTAAPRIAELWNTDAGRDTLTRWTRRLAGGLALVQSYGYATFVQKVPGAVAHPGLGFLAKTMAVLTSGAIGVMLLSERLSRSSDDEPDAGVKMDSHDEPHDESAPNDAPHAIDEPASPRALPAGDAPIAEWYRPRGDGVEVPRDQRAND